MKIKNYLIVAMALVFGVALLSSCGKDNGILTPKVTENSVVRSGNKATFAWYVDWPGKKASVVEISQNEDMSGSQSYGSEIETENSIFSVDVNGLQDASTYYYRYVVWNREYENNKYRTEVKSLPANGGSIPEEEGEEESDTLKVTIVEVGHCDWQSAVINCNVSMADGVVVTRRGVCWGTSPNPVYTDLCVSSGDGAGDFSAVMKPLEEETLYYVRAYAVYNANGVIGINYSEQQTITTTAIPSVPTGAIDGFFSVDEAHKIWFSQGNLQYIGGSSIVPYWKFADEQWETIGNSQGVDGANVDRDLFGWGTSGWNSGAVCYQPWSTSRTDNYYYPGGSYSNNLTGNYVNADWGVYNAISNGGNQTGQWRTLTKDEWVYVFNTRSTSSGKRYAIACVNNVNGVILLPDDWNTGYYSLSSTNNPSASFSSNTITATQWSALEQHGAVFLPAAGHRGGTSVYSVGFNGFYWSASCSNKAYAYSVRFYDSSFNPQGGNYRDYGYSVRLVRDAQ